MRQSLIFLALITSPAFAASNGTNVSWSDYTDMVNNNCTGTIISGNHVITAAHCDDLKRSLKLQNGTWVNPSSVEEHPNHASSSNSDFDVAVLTLPNKVDTSDIHFFADLNTNPVTNNEEVRLFGFADTYNQLSYATMTIDSSPTGITPTTRYTAEKTANGGESTAGDSGGAWLNSRNDIVSIHNGSDYAGSVTDYTYGINLFSVKDFILTSINGWHYPTIASGNGAKTITVQSLHSGGVADAAYTEGSITITGGTCYGNNSINEFEKCTYELDVTGEGKLWLSNNEFIHINKPSSTSDNGSSGGKSGASTSFAAMLALLGLGFIRRRQQK